MARKRNTDNDIVLSTGSASARRKPASTARPRRTPTAQVSQPEEPETVAAEQSEVVAGVVSTPLVAEISREEIAVLAYSYWEARGCEGGTPEEDWLRAEHELRSRNNLSTTAHA